MFIDRSFNKMLKCVYLFLTSFSESKMGSEEAPPWEFPWETDKMRENNQPWSLAGDSGMYLYLQKSSADFTSRVLESQSKIETLNGKASTLCNRLDNAFNDFQLLSNTQFLENRIEEEAPEAADAASQQANIEASKPKVLTKEEKEEQLKATFKKCLADSLQIYENIQKLESSTPGMESDERRIFDNRPSLPFIIGTEQYRSSPTAGVIFKTPQKTPVAAEEPHSDMNDGELQENDPGQSVTNGVQIENGDMSSGWYLLVSVALILNSMTQFCFRRRAVIYVPKLGGSAKWKSVRVHDFC